MKFGRIVSSQSSRVRQNIVIGLAAWCALMFAPMPSWSGPIVVFGDSLSDVGNAYAATGGKVPPVPYYAGRFSNGNLWVEKLAYSLAAPRVTPSSQGGTDYAYAGAATGATPLGTQLGTPTGYSPFMTSDGKFIANVPSLPSQVSSFIASLKGGMPTTGALAIVWAGANDFFDGQTNPSIPAKNIAAAVSALIGAGVRNFLIPNLPDLSKTPFGLSSSAATQQGLHALSVGFDQALSADLGPLTSAAGVNIHTLDTFGLFQKIQANPALFHLGNVTQEGILTGNPAAPGYLFWDGVHPTTAGHAILASQAYAAVTPEPGSLTLLVIGLIALLGIGWPGLRLSLRRPAGCLAPCAGVALRPCLVLLGLFLVFLDVSNLIAEDPPMPRSTSGVPQMEGMTVLEPSVPAGATSPWPRGLLTPPVAAPGEYPLLGADRPSAYCNGGPMFDLDVMLGMFMGIRAQAAVYRNSYLACVVEGFYGAILDELATGEGAGAAGRVYFHRTDRAGYNSILIGPGVGAYCHFHHDLWMVAPTVDVAWVRPIGDLASWELGLNAGVGVGVAGDSQTNGVGRATPLISVFMGFRF
jgi:phospholipase/lecithinase/hemolysin